MKHKLLVLCALMSLSSVCAADVTGYGAIRSGVSNMHTDFDHGPDLSDTVANLGVAGGARFRDGGGHRQRGVRLDGYPRDAAY